MDKIRILNEKNREVYDNYEIDETYLVKYFIRRTDVVLELGGRLGKISCHINRFLVNKKNHVVIEPNLEVIPILKKNKKINNAQFHICTDVIGNGSDRFKLNSQNPLGANVKKCSTGSVQTITYSDLCSKYNLNFNVIVVDCEGCLDYVSKTNSDIFKNKRLIMLEHDNVDNVCYQKVYDKLEKAGLVQVTRPNCFQQIWINTNLF